MQFSTILRIFADGTTYTITVRITHSEQSLITALDFMVEKMTVTPLNDAHRSELSGQCRQVIEEETKRGFRVKLII